MTIYDIGFDTEHDMHISGADIAFTDENTALIQRLKIRIQFLLSGWFLNNRAGIPYTQFVLKQGASIEDIYTIFNDEIKNTEGVENIVSLELTPDASSKGLRIDFSVNNGIISDSIEVTI